MTIKQNRKNSQEIKKEILSQLNKQPLSVEQLRKRIEDSNWSTINKYLSELKEEGQVREIISTDKIKIYQRVVGDTYFDLPITEEQRKRFHSLFSMIFKEYKKKGKIPKKTEVAKCAVYAIDNNKTKLNDLPIVWYLYGMVPIMVVEPSAKYSDEITLEGEKNIREAILEFIEKNGDKKSSQIKKEQHRRYNEEIYVLTDELFDILNKPNFENKEIIGILEKFFIACPVDNEFSEIFDLTDDLISLIKKMSSIGLNLQKYRKEILLAFDCLWKFIALYKLYRSAIITFPSITKEALINFYLGNAIEDRKRFIKESVSELNLIYLNKLSNFDHEKMELSKEAKEASKIMEDWTGED